MDESGAENQPKGQIIHRKNAASIDSNESQKRSEKKKLQGTVGSKHESWLRKKIKTLAPRATLAALGALGTVGVVKGVEEELNADDADNAIVTRLTTDVHAEEKIVENEPSQESDNAEEEGLYDIVFHDLTPEQEQEARAWVDDFKERIKAKPGYEKEHRMIPQQYKEIIQEKAEKYGLPPEMLYGIIAIENGGGEDVTNKISGARGVVQFMKRTGEQYGLVDEEKGYDHRGDPVLSIDAAGRYLHDHKEMLGEDIGLTIWSYHAGIGNVNEALSVYFQDKYGEDIGFYDGNINVAKAKELMTRDKLDFYKLVSNEQVKRKVISKLHDYSDTYVPSVLALIELENERKVVDLGGGLTVDYAAKTFPGR